MTKLFYVVGASGAGKDSVMAYARARLGENAPCVFAHRYITRPAEAGSENHVALSDLEFELRLCRGLFCMDWNSHGLRYGIGIEVEHWLERGMSVVVNGSRKYLNTARRRFPQLQPVLITVSPEILRERLLSRGRESLEEIEERIERSGKASVDPSQATLIRNDGALEEAGEAFLRVVSTDSLVA